MKNVKLSLLLLAALAAQPFTANAMFARFAAFAKTKATSVKSFFSSSTTPRWNFANPFRYGKQVFAGTAVATPLLAATGTKPTETKDAEATTITMTDAYKRYMVAIIEKMGPGKKESCHNISIKDYYSNYNPKDQVWIKMDCPRTTALGNKSSNDTLRALTEIDRLEKIKQRLDAQGFLTELDRTELKIENRDTQQLEQQIKEAQNHIKGLTPASIINKSSGKPSVYGNPFTGDFY
jgi:hypothetical protein